MMIIERTALQELLDKGIETVILRRIGCGLGEDGILDQRVDLRQLFENLTPQLANKTP